MADIIDGPATETDLLCTPEILVSPNFAVNHTGRRLLQDVTVCIHFFKWEKNTTWQKNPAWTDHGLASACTQITDPLHQTCSWCQMMKTFRRIWRWILCINWQQRMYLTYWISALSSWNLMVWLRQSSGKWKMKRNFRLVRIVQIKINLPMCWQQIAKYELQQMTMEMANETETTQSNATRINTAWEWLDINDDDSPESLTDILEIVRRCLKEVKWLKIGHTFKMMTQLTAIAKYVKLRAHYHTCTKCTQPCESGSLAIARQMGKGEYFASQIRQNESGPPVICCVLDQWWLSGWKGRCTEDTCRVKWIGQFMPICHLCRPRPALPVNLTKNWFWENWTRSLGWWRGKICSTVFL